LALALAFAPVIANLAGHFVATPWARYSLVFVPLFAWSLLREPAARPGRLEGGALIGLGLALELGAAAIGMTQIGRPGLALAAIGLCRWMGIAGYRTALLALFAIPIPHELVQRLTGRAEVVKEFALAAELLRSLGESVLVGWPNVESARGTLQLTPADAGLPLAVGLAGLGWYRGIRAGRSLVSTAGGAALWGSLALPLQIVLLVASVALVSRGRPDLARVLLSGGFWLAVALATVVATERHAHRTGVVAPRGHSAEAVAN